MTLYELNCLVRDALDEALPDIYWVQGELSEGRQGYGGHFYGELVQKDDRSAALVARARLTCWANTYRTLARQFEAQTGQTLHAGMKVLLAVTVSFHPQYGFSLSIQDIDPSYTLGDMARRRQDILRQLEADGILHDNQDLALPLVPRRVAIVSSQTAAGYGDFCKQLLHNSYGFQFRLRLFPAVMQGSRVEESIIQALQQVADEAGEWDVVVVIRGGGATSDLSDFDSYPLAACVAQMPLPVIVGIGHDRDETVLDHVAHTHLKTPTAVADFLLDCMGEQALRLDDLSQRLTLSVRQRLTAEQQRLQRLATLLPLTCRSVGEREQHRLGLLRQRLVAAVRERQLHERHRLDLFHERLRLADPALLLQRGYAMVFDSRGRLLRDAAQVAPGQQVVARLAQGQLTAIVKDNA